MGTTSDWLGLTYAPICVLCSVKKVGSRRWYDMNGQISLKYTKVCKIKREIEGDLVEDAEANIRWVTT
jgi:hypothetical protein